VFLVFVAGTTLFWFLIYAGSLIMHTTPEQMVKLPADQSLASASVIIRYVQVSQQISLFLIPSFVILYLIKIPGQSLTGMNRFPRPVLIFIIICLSVSIIPVTTFTGILNSTARFPQWMSGLEVWMREKENYASKLTGMLMDSQGAGSLGINILILAVIPAIGEELFFRGVLQQLMIRIFGSSHFGVWITAIIFSTIHLQFFGFLPRLILGLSFGYIFLWSRNLWLAVIAHFINNLLPVVVTYLAGENGFREKVNEYAGRSFFILFFSVLICVLIFSFLKRNFDKSGISPQQ
jgi:membrane protease YdiL (CAAX protease family)